MECVGIFFSLFLNKSDDYCICTSKIVKPRIKTGFLLLNNHLNFWGQIQNFKWILCSQKIGVKCGYLRFLLYRYILYIVIFQVIYLHNDHGRQKTSSPSSIVNQTNIIQKSYKPNILKKQGEKEDHSICLSAFSGLYLAKKNGIFMLGTLNI